MSRVLDLGKERKWEGRGRGEVGECMSCTSTHLLDHNPSPTHPSSSHSPRGSYASVMEASRLRPPHGKVAIKRIDLSRFRNSSRNMINFDREVGILTSTKHPNAISIMDVYYEESNLYVVTELALGGDLYTRINQRGRLSEPECRVVLKQLLDVLSYLHSRGITHRDLKPENVMLVDPNSLTIKLADFGLAKLVGNDALLRTVCGTMNYSK